MLDAVDTAQGGSGALMTGDTVRSLLELNRRFYALVGPAFDATRQGIPAGMKRALDYLPRPSGSPLRVLDVGCGNGRLARALNGLRRPIAYVGVDNDGLLLARAAKQTANLEYVETEWVQADLADPQWCDGLPHAGYEAAFCLAVLQHFPSEALRIRILKETAALAAGGVVVLGTWQFRNSPRLMARLQPWSAVGLGADDVEAGDALLPWDQGVHALRYVHAIGLDEIARAAEACRWKIAASYFDDGADGKLNLYAVLGPNGPEK